MKTRRLAFLATPYHRGGVSRWMVDFFSSWCEAGNGGWFVAPQPRAPFFNGAGRPTVFEMLSQQGRPALCHIAAPRVGWEFEFGTERYRARVLADAMSRSIPAGTPVITSYDRAAWRAAAALADRNPFVGVLHSDSPHCYALFAEFRSALAAAVAVSSRIESRATRLMGAEHFPIATIPCSTSVQAENSEPEARDADLLRLIWIGRMAEEEKRVSDLVPIAQGLAQTGVRFQFDIIGDGPARDAVARAADDLQLGDRLRLRGWCTQAEVAHFLGHAHVLVLPSNFEGMPVVVMEALASGCAIVASRTSGVEDFEHHDLARNCYWVFDVGNVDEAVRCIREAGRVEPSTRAAAARALARAELSHSVCVARYARLVDSIQGRGGRRVYLLPRAATWIEAVPVALQRLTRVRLLHAPTRAHVYGGQALSTRLERAPHTTDQTDGRG